MKVLGAIAEISAPAWDALFANEAHRATPFLSHAWLDALERSGAASPRTGWRPRHLTLWKGGRLVAAAPAYAKDDSDGDFSRDWAWAEAAERAAIPYYPKLVLGVPFTPATGRRILVAPGEDRLEAVGAIAQATRDLAAGEGLSSIHFLFPCSEEAVELEGAGLALRLDFQYHWRNEGYDSPEEFLARFSSKRRNMIRRERAAPGRQGIAIRTIGGEELAKDPDGWAGRIFALHRTTVDRLPWGRRFLGRAFYARVLRAMPQAVEVVEARREGRLIAMAFNIMSSSRLYGRYWGAIEEHPFLHFNVCLYHSVDECIRRGLEAFEGGAGGEHKLARGFEPAETWSAHAFLDARLDRALRRHLDVELRERRLALARWREASPVLRPRPPDRQSLSARLR